MSTLHPLSIHVFGPGDPLERLGESRASQYVRRYLADLGCKVIIEEPIYFDHDYLAEFAAFYCKSTRGYRNSCSRLHFFADANLDRERLEQTVGELEGSVERLRESYLGFAVVRPFDPPLLGRTVIKWYPPNLGVAGSRVTTPSRLYVVHLAGVRLEVEGLAWQPQDRAVGACATVALWTMMHSSAFDDHHAIPTTAAITEAAHRQASLGSRVFPSSGLTTYQIFEAIKAQNLAPHVLEGDVVLQDGNRGFTRERFLATFASFVRSGYPVLVWGLQLDRNPAADARGLHAICITGFREIDSLPSLPPPDHVHLIDSNVEVAYVHDDGLGPGVRCRVDLGSTGEVLLTPEAPSSQAQHSYVDPSIGYPQFRPMSMVVAVHDGLMISSDVLHEIGLSVAYEIRDMLSLVKRDPRPVVSLQTRFISLREYLAELRTRLGRGCLLARVRLLLAEAATPMSLHLGLVQLRIDGTLLADILFDTTDNEQYVRAFAHLRFDPLCGRLMPLVETSLGRHLGVGVDAFESSDG